jgi:hypothetical protein
MKKYPKQAPACNTSVQKNPPPPPATTAGQWLRRRAPTVPPELADLIARLAGVGPDLQPPRRA